MTRCAVNSIALVSAALLVVLGHHGDAANLLPEHVASMVDNRVGHTQTNEINVAKQCAAVCSPIRQCHIDPGCRENQLTCQLYRLGHGELPMICRKVTKCDEHCVDRDRGAPHDAAPPTPPYVRVAYTAVREVALTRAK